MAAQGSLLDHPRITRSYFFPRPDAPDDTVVVEVEGAELACSHHHIDDKAHTVVHFHGNGETVADYVPDMADILNDIGLNAFFVEYRGYGDSTGTPGLYRQLQDIPAIVDHLDVDPSRLIPFGRSIGSIFAVHLVSLYPDVAGLILDSPIADVLERILLRVSPRDLDTTYEIIKDEVLDHLDHHQKVADFDRPLLILHARHDHLVNASHARRLHTWAGSLQNRLVLFKRGDHNSLYAQNEDDYLRHLRLFFAMHAG